MTTETGPMKVSSEFRHVAPRSPGQRGTGNFATNSRCCSSASLPQEFQVGFWPTESRASSAATRYPASRTFPICPVLSRNSSRRIFARIREEMEIGKGGPARANASVMLPMTLRFLIAMIASAFKDRARRKCVYLEVTWCSLSCRSRRGQWRSRDGAESHRRGRWVSAQRCIPDPRQRPVVHEGI